MFVNRPWLKFVVNPDEIGGSGPESPAGSTPNPAEGGEGDENQSGDSGDSNDDKPGDGEPDAESLKARIAELEKDRDKWKTHARTWEERAKSKKENSADESGKSDIQRLEAELAELREASEKREAEVAARERKALIATIAAEEGVTAKDIEFLPDSDDEDVVRKFAKRLAVGGRGAESNNFGGSTGASKEAVIDRVKSL